MDGTISLRISGRRNNWFSSPTTYAPLLILLAAVILGTSGFLALFYRQSVDPVGQALKQLESVNQQVAQLTGARMQVESALASGDSSTYAAAERALVQSVNAFDQTGKQILDYFTFSNLEQLSSDYLNGLRSLTSITTNGAPPATQAILRQQLDKTALALNQAGNEAIASSMAVVGERLDAAAASTTSSGWLLLLIQAVLFGAFGALALAAVRRREHALEQFTQAALRLAQRQYDSPVDLADADDPRLARLVDAFNRIAEMLKTAMQSESAANKQNHQQIMKLARQERMTAVLEERQRIARELHDSVKQQLFSITLSAGAAVNLLERSPQSARSYLEHIQQAGHTAQAEMTALIQELVPASLQEQRLEEALLGYLNPLCETHGLKLLWRVNGTNTLTIAQEHALLRAVQEAISNVIRHSDATVVRVSLSFGLVTHVIVEDNGKGFVPDAVAPTATGLSLMKTRLARVGGGCELQTTPGVGTRLSILMDLRRVAVSYA